MLHIVTDRVAWSVCRSVCHDRELCKNGLTDRDAVWVVDSGRWAMGSTLVPPDEYDWTVHVRQRCDLLSNYFDHLLKIARMRWTGTAKARLWGQHKMSVDLRRVTAETAAISAVVMCWVDRCKSQAVLWQTISQCAISVMEQRAGISRSAVTTWSRA